jgi:TM2 domain-containing membrane protein YozV
MVNSQRDSRGNASAHPPARPLDPLAAVLSYLVPGLGQIYQGRIGKGVLFLVSIYTLFFYGIYLGSGSVTVDGTTYHLVGSVYLPATVTSGAPDRINNPHNLSPLMANLYNRPQFLAQFWTGVVAWPAIWHYTHSDPAAGDRDSGFAEDQPGQPHWLFGDFERAPSIRALNAVTTAGDKRLDLGWVFTVIAGVLNIMIIYDALAGPAFPAPAHSTPAPTPAEAAA